MIHNDNDTRLATSNRHLLRYDCFPTPTKNLKGGFRCPAFPIIPIYKMILVAGEVGTRVIPLTTIFNIKSMIISQPIIFIYFDHSYQTSVDTLEAFDADLA